MISERKLRTNRGGSHTILSADILRLRRERHELTQDVKRLHRHIKGMKRLALKIADYGHPKGGCHG